MANIIKTIPELAKFLDLSERQTVRIIKSGVLPRNESGWKKSDVKKFQELYELRKIELVSILIKNEKDNKQNTSLSKIKKLKEDSKQLKKLKVEVKKLRQIKEDLTVVNINKLQLA